MNRAWVVCAALMVLFSSTGASARAADRAPATTKAPDALPDVATIRAKIRAATGPLPDVYRETEETIAPDTRVVERHYRRGNDLRTVMETGPFHTERGIFGGRVWHMNENGQVVLDEPDPGQAPPEPTTTTVTAVRTPVAGYVIATLNVRGYGVKEYVDGTTWQVVRRERIGANGTAVTTFDDIRADRGRTFAHHVIVDDGYTQTVSEVRVLEYAPGDVAPADVAMPRARRALIEFPAGVTSVDLPATFGQSHIFVRVNVGGRGLDFVLDSGASGITIDPAVARELGLREYQKHSAVTAGRYTTARAVVPEMRIGPLRMRDVAVLEVPQGWQTAPGVKEVGLLGFDFLAELGVTIDYEHQRVTVVPSAAYRAPSDPNAIPLDVRLGSGQPRTSAVLNGALGERWVLDTGGPWTFLVFDYFARRYPAALRDEGGGGLERRQRFYGVGGVIPTAPLQIESLQLANVNFAGFVGYRVTGSGTYAQNDDGVIGYGFLKMFTLGFDYAHGRVYLVPNRAGQAAMGLP